MHKFLNLAILLFLLGNILNAQNSNYQNGIGLSVRAINSGILQSNGIKDSNTILGVDLSYSRNILPFFNVAVPLGATVALVGDKKFLGIHSDVLLQFGLFNDRKIIAPYLYFGPSFNLNKNFIEDKLNEFSITGRGGLGANVGITEQLLLNVQLGYLNSFKKGDKGSAEAGLGVIYIFGGGAKALSKSTLSSRKLNKSDRDNDGIPDLEDDCPTVPGVAAFSGCPDTDNDGIADYEDKCPNEAGSLTAQGCPDKDGDGVPDKEDKCPDIAGSKNYSGCPFFDKDQDGVPDDKDLCPDQKGLLRYNGCPDSDGDGVPDNIDQCLDKVGSVEAQGCPDTDNDGVPDKEDKCPTKVGPASNNGCPVANQPDLDALTKASRAITLAAQEKVIPKSAMDELDAIAAIMKKNKKYTLRITGYGDELTPDPNALTLAQARADAVKEYLISRGIDADRLKISTKTLPMIVGRKIMFDFL